jgi:hypothetical protein
VVIYGECSVAGFEVEVARGLWGGKCYDTAGELVVEVIVIDYPTLPTASLTNASFDYD